MKDKKIVRQKISYLLCTIGGMWILTLVFLRYESLNLFSRCSLIFIGITMTIFNGYYYMKSRNRRKNKSGSKHGMQDKRSMLDELNESYKQGLITTEEYKKSSNEILSND